jgi:hypothetical protein
LGFEKGGIAAGMQGERQAAGPSRPASRQPPAQARLVAPARRTENCKQNSRVQRISGSAVAGAPTEEPRSDASNARSQRPATATRATGVSRALACVLSAETPVVAHRRFTLPRSSILCGCINIPGRQANAVWGRYPTAWRVVYVKKQFGVH